MKEIKVEHFENYYANVGESFLEEEMSFPFTMRFFFGYLCAAHPDAFKRAMDIFMAEAKRGGKAKDLNRLSFFDLLDVYSPDDSLECIFPSDTDGERYDFESFYSCFADIGNSYPSINKWMWKLLGEHGGQSCE